MNSCRRSTACCLSGAQQIGVRAGEGERRGARCDRADCRADGLRRLRRLFVDFVLYFFGRCINGGFDLLFRLYESLTAFRAEGFSFFGKCSAIRTYWHICVHPFCLVILLYNREAGLSMIFYKNTSGERYENGFTGMFLSIRNAMITPQQIHAPRSVIRTRFMTSLPAITET